MTMFWNRQNEPIADVLEWARLYETAEYRIVAYDVEANHAVSTIWQGLDLSHQLRPTTESAMIFETAYIVDDIVLDTLSWHSEDGALAGHRMMCVKLLGRPERPGDGYRDALLRSWR